jgi:D-alanyl-D-alanine-carboxypeptidase/D-alanyl-D-alanine-endopeptidase
MVEKNLSKISKQIAKMVEKLTKDFIKFAKRDKIPNMSFAFLDFEKQQLHIENFEHPDLIKNQNTSNLSLYEIGSITKLFTALCYGILDVQGKININTPVKEYFSDRISIVFESITLYDLLTHRSGLPRLPDEFIARIGNNDNPYTLFTKNDLINYLQNPKDISSSKKYQYSNLGFGILGNILETITGEKYEEAVKQILLNPLKMQNSATLDSLSVDSMNLLDGYNKYGSITEYWENTTLAGAGSFLSCISDMVLFLSSHLKGFESDSFSLEEITNTRLSNNMSYGWHIKKGIVSRILRYAGYYWHNGMTGGFSSFICFNKKKKTGMAILSNKSVMLDSYFYHYTSYFH